MNINHIENKNRFETTIDSHKAFVTYEISDGYLDIRHTLVPDELKGQGIAGKLVKAAYDYAINNNLKAKATCSYAVKWLEKHPEYNGVIGNDYQGEGCCAL